MAFKQLPISPLCDRGTTDVNASQIGFIEFIVAPIWQVTSPEGRLRALPSQPAIPRTTHYTPNTTDYILQTTHYTLHTTHYTMHTAHYTLHTSNYTLN